MRIHISLFTLFFAFWISFFSYAQIDKVKIEDFVSEHSGFEENEDGEIVPINIKEINKKIRFFVEEKYPNVELTRNIIWDSYTTFLSPSDKFHFHVFIVQVKVHKMVSGEKDQIIVRKKQDIERLKYLEVIYNPFTDKVSSNFKWFSDDEEFYAQEEENKTKDPDLESLKIANQDQKANIPVFVNEHEGFIEELKIRELSEDEIIPKNVKEINTKIRAFVKSKYSNVQYSRNIIWDNYNTFLSPFDKYHFHTFIVQTKVRDMKRLKYLEVVYNPVTESVSSDFIWIDEDEEFYREDSAQEKTE